MGREYGNQSGSVIGILDENSLGSEGWECRLAGGNNSD